MSTKIQIRGILLLLAVTSAALLIAIFLYAQQQITQNSATITEDHLVTLSQISSRIELRFNDEISILQIASKNDHMTDPPNTSLIDPKLNGIPENADTDKRRIMQDIFYTYGQFQNMLFLVPNGDVYINEPYVFQKNMTTSSFAFRDWYKDTMASQKPVVSKVVVSKSSGKPNVVIAVPVFSQDGPLEGILTASVSLDILQQQLPELRSFGDERILIVDNFGTVASDSDGILKGEHSPIGSDEIQMAIAGQSGSATDIVNGTKTFVVYQPAQIGQTRWAVISIEPYDEAFSSINTTIQESYVFAGLIAVIVSISSYFLYRAFQARITMSSELEKSNFELQKQSQKLREVDIAKEEFSAMVAHELKTPLVTINGYSEMLKEPGALGNLNKEQEEAVNKIYSSSKKLENLIGDILAAQKLDMRKMHFNKTNFEVQKFMENIVQTYSAITNDKKINFLNDTQENFSIKTDKDRLSQVFDNLIRNSIDFVPDVGGRIVIGVKNTGRLVEFFVKDNGIGIPQDKQNNLFKKFYQIDSSLKRQHGGTGLGLVICKGIVEGLGGRIQLESEPGKGTTVYFSIPQNNGTAG